MKKWARASAWAPAGIVIVAPAVALADQAYLKEPDAPRAMFPESDGSVRKTLELSGAELEFLSRTLGRRIEARTYPYLEVHKGPASVGFIFIMDVLGQTLPITFAVGAGVDGALRDVQVMVYREPRGEEIQEARFRRQFKGKRLQDPLALGRDIDAITGATISARSAAYAARKGLALAAILLSRPAPGGK